MNFYTDNPSLSLHLHHPDMARVAETAEKGFAEQGAGIPVNSEEAIQQYEMILDLLGSISAEVIAPNAADVDLEGPHLVDGRVQYAAGTRKTYSCFLLPGSTRKPSIPSCSISGISPTFVAITGKW